MEACATGHHWARTLMDAGHEVRLIPPNDIKPYLRRQKNDAADATAICEAVTRPSMRFVPVKSEDQQATLMLHSARELLMSQRTALINAIELVEVPLDLTHRHAAGIHRDDLLVEIGKTTLVFGDLLMESTGCFPRDGSLHRLPSTNLEKQLWRPLTRISHSLPLASTSARKSFILWASAPTDKSLFVGRLFKRSALVETFKKLPPCIVGMEACLSAHFVSRALRHLGHTPRIIPAIYVKPFVKGQKNDYNDAEAIAEAALEPICGRSERRRRISSICRRVHERLRSRLISRRTATINQIRAFLIEQGITVRTGSRSLRKSLVEILRNRQDEISPRMHDLIIGLLEDWLYLDARI